VTYPEIVDQLKRLSDPEAVKGMARYGINPQNAYGVSIPKLRRIAAQAGKHHDLAEKLWSSGIHEARILASMVELPGLVTEEQMDRWVADFNSWDLCDQCCNNLFSRTGLAWSKAHEWTAQDEEFVKRAGFVMMAVLAVHDKKAADEDFLRFMPAIKAGGNDERNYVKKAVNWALRQIGKRNLSLNRQAIGVATEMAETDSKAARWIASDAIRELTSEAVRNRLRTPFHKYGSILA
jgi:3-methyladenine DNA glycosylase AlkD